jgi:hypothetical protein
MELPTSLRAGCAKYGMGKRAHVGTATLPTYDARTARSGLDGRCRV